jgi:nucleoside-diphosphate-sugar epimerase
MRVGITGATGSLGGKLSEYLKDKHLDVAVFVRENSEISRIKRMNFEIFYGDISKRESLADFIKNVDVCFHLAAVVGMSYSKKDYEKINIEGTENVCRSILENNPRCHLVYCSTTSVLRINPLVKFRYNPYAISKYYAEKVVEKYEKNGLICTVIYPGWIYGPGDMSFVPVIAKLIRNGKIFFVRGGEKGLGLIYIDDLCELFYLAAVNPVAKGKRYISVKGLDIGMEGFIRIVAERIGFPLAAKKYPKTPVLLAALMMEAAHGLFLKNTVLPFDVRLVEIMSSHFKYDYENATKDLGWKHTCSVQEGLNNAFSWYKLKGIEL